MLKDITLGQYYPADSVIHRLDPRVKLAATMVLLVVLFCFNSFIGYFCTACALALLVKVSKVPGKFLLKGMRAILFLVVFSGIYSLLFTGGDHMIASFFIFHISVEGIIRALAIMIRLALLVIGSSFLTYTTTPNDLADGMEKAMSPLKIFHVPVGDIAMILSIALRFIPILVEELDKIMKAQTARGIDFNNGSIVEKAKNMVPVFVPLFVSSIRRASDLAAAMEARCYQGGDKRTKMKPLCYKKRDKIAYLSLFVIAVLLLCTNAAASLLTEYVPALDFIMTNI